MSNGQSDSAQRVRQLNDAFRRSFVGGVVFITSGFEALPAEQGSLLLAQVRAFDVFNEANDPHGEHAFGVVEDGGVRRLTKITITTATWSSCRLSRPTPRSRPAC
jgi:hypothetical protein